jgi:serine/threonine protein kinase
VNCCEEPIVQEQPNVRAIFDRALEIESAEERVAYLVQACGADAQVRREVETLLSAHSAAGEFLEVSPAAEISSAADLDPPLMFTAPGTMIGPYKLLEPIGEGGYGTVFMAEQTSPLHRKVALKIIKAGMDTRQVIARFEAERQALALMDHPNIAKVFDAGMTDTGRPYFVMELVKGMPITKYCDAHHIEPRQRLELFMQVCQAVQHAHQKGIIHRDIKPNNVLVAQYDGNPVPKVIDFGVAKATGQALTDLTMFTGFGDVIGTLEYMSPEQAEVNQLDVDTRSDIYSLGVLLYELLTGTTPLEHKRVMKGGLLEMLRVVREEEPPRPSMRLSMTEQLPSISANRGVEPKKLSGLVKGELDWIVMKALEKDRGRRYETASGFATDLRRYLDDEAVQACPPSTRYRFRKFARRNKAALTTAALVCVVLLLGTVISSWQAIRATRAERAAAAEAKRAKTEEATAQAVIDFLNRDLLGQTHQVPYDRYDEPRSELRLVTVLDRAARALEGRFPDQPLVEASLRQTIGKSYTDLDDSGRAILHFQRAVELRRAQLGEDHPATLVSLEALGLTRKDPDLMTRVVEARRRVLGRDHPNTLRSLFILGLVTRQKGDPARAIQIWRETLEAQRRVLGEADDNTAWTMHCLASTLYMNAGKAGVPAADDREIESMFRQALAVTRKALGESWHTAVIAQGLGHFLNTRHRYAEAEAVFKDEYARLESLPGASPELMWALANELTGIYENWEKPQQAAEWDRKRIATTRPR